MKQHIAITGRHSPYSRSFFESPAEQESSEAWGLWRKNCYLSDEHSFCSTSELYFAFHRYSSQRYLCWRLKEFQFYCPSIRQHIVLSWSGKTGLSGKRKELEGIRGKSLVIIGTKSRVKSASKYSQQIFMKPRYDCGLFVLPVGCFSTYHPIFLALSDVWNLEKNRKSNLISEVWKVRSDKTLLPSPYLVARDLLPKTITQCWQLTVICIPPVNQEVHLIWRFSPEKCESLLPPDFKVRGISTTLLPDRL